MTYLSRIDYVELLRSSGIRGFSDNAQGRHQMVMSMFGDADSAPARASLGVLFRVEDLEGDAVLLVRSAVEPNQGQTIRERHERLTAEQRVMFRVTAAPVKRHGRTKTEMHLAGYEAQENWLESRLGMALRDVEVVRHSEESLKRSASRKSGMLRLAQFDGVATIKDPDALRLLLRSGVGRSKSYGAGLLTVKAI